jgi:hypothetical protein
MLWLITVISSPVSVAVGGKSRPGASTLRAGALGSMRRTPVDIQARGDELAVVGKAGDPLADNDRQLLMPSPRDLLCGGGFQEKLNCDPSLFSGRAGFDRDCKLR